MVVEVLAVVVGGSVVVAVVVVVVRSRRRVSLAILHVNVAKPEVAVEERLRRLCQAGDGIGSGPASEELRKRWRWRSVDPLGQGQLTMAALAPKPSPASTRRRSARICTPLGSRRPGGQEGLRTCRPAHTCATSGAFTVIEAGSPPFE